MQLQPQIFDFGILGIVLGGEPLDRYHPGRIVEKRLRDPAQFSASGTDPACRLVVRDGDLLDRLEPERFSSCSCLGCTRAQASSGVPSVAISRPALKASYCFCQVWRCSSLTRMIGRV